MERLGNAQALEGGHKLLQLRARKHYPCEGHFIRSLLLLMPPYPGEA